MKEKSRSVRWSWLVSSLLSMAVALGGFSSVLAAPLPGGTLDPLTIPKYVQPLVIPPPMPVASVPGTPAADYNIAVRQFKQQILPGGAWNAVAPACIASPGLCNFPATTVWSYGKGEEAIPTNFVAPVPLSTSHAAALPGQGISFNYPAFTVENTSGTPTKVRWINGLLDASGNFLPHLLAVDQTLNWANPAQDLCNHGLGNRTDCETKNLAPYTGPVPMVVHVHGAHVNPDSDGYPEGWWLPAAPGTAGIPATYAERGSVFTQADNTNTAPGSAFYSYRNDQPASTIWYHDHTLGMTRLNVYAGPAGFWLIRNGVNDINTVGVLPGPAPAAYNPAHTPAAINDPNFNTAYRNTIREIPIAIQDRSFDWADATGAVLPTPTGATQVKLFYPADRSFFDGFTGPYIGNSQDGLLNYIDGIGPGTPQQPLGNSDISGIWNPEAFFNTMVVNGTTWPQLDVTDARYRLRLLNGCNSRSLNLALFVVYGPGVDNVMGTADDDLGAPKTLGSANTTVEVPFYQIGGDQGFLPQVVKITTGFSTLLPAAADTAASFPDKALLLMNAERADVIVDFTGLAHGTRIRMINTAPDAPFGGFPDVPADAGTTGQVMDFFVNIAGPTAIPHTAIDNGYPTTIANLPLAAVAEVPLGAESNTRPLSLNELVSDQVCVNISVTTGAITTLFSRPPGDLAFAADCLATPPLAAGDLVDFAGPRQARMGVMIANGTGGFTPVPKGWHDPVTEYPLLGATEVWEFYNTTVDAHPVHVHLVGFQVVNRQQLDPLTLAPVAGTLTLPEPNELGYKDTVTAYPGQVTRVKAKFDIAGLYVWHCHIVEHEDNEMMRPYTVVTTLTATMATPVNNAVLAGASQVFTWNNSGASLYQLHVGTSVGGSDLGQFPAAGTTATTTTVTGLPVNGSTIYVRLWSLNGATWSFNDYTYTAAGTFTKAAMVTPAGGSVLAGASQVFTWSNAGANLYQLHIGRTVGGSDLGTFPAAGTTATTATVTGLPVNGSAIYVRLWSLNGANWFFNDYTYTAAGTFTKAAMVTPVGGSVLAGASQVFTWSNAGANLYQLHVGSAVGGSDLGTFPAAGTTATTTTVTGLPVSGSAIYVRLWSLNGATWSFNDYTYTASGTFTKAAMVTPVGGSVLAGASQVFTWSNAGANLYQLHVGRAVGGSDLGTFPAAGTTATTTTVTGLPVSGSAIYVRLWSLNGATWSFNDYTYTASGTFTKAAMVTPVGGSVLAGASQVFTWSNAGANLYQLQIGRAVGGSDLGTFPAAGTTATTTTVTGLPVSGSAIYVRLWSLNGTNWTFNDYTYTAAGTATAATMVTPVNLATISGASQAFTWSNVGANLYQLWVGTTVGGSTLGTFPAAGTTATTFTTTGLPTTGTINVRLWSLFGSTWMFNDYSYTAGP